MSRLSLVVDLWQPIAMAGRALLDYASKRQSVVARSTAEAETVACDEMNRRSVIPLEAVFTALLRLSGRRTTGTGARTDRRDICEYSKNETQLFAT